ncbi:MAG: glycosyltransferase family 2 protein [Candidatus Omnitrophota bacterium]|nr:glycosyltransferase [Candidatus Omnitrophota bacterium]
MNKVSLYIPCFNAGAYLKKTLDSVFRQNYPIDEVMIIDDGSTDCTADIAKEFPVKIISHVSNLGLAEARNTAFKEARNEFVAALDADCIAHPEWLSELMRYFNSDKIAGVGGMLIDKNFLNVANRWRCTHMLQHWGNDIVYDPPFLSGSNNVMRKSVLKKTGYYSKKFKTNYEDVDISKRIYGFGFRLVYNSNAQVEHIKIDNIKSVLQGFWLRQYYSRNNITDKNTAMSRVINAFSYLEKHHDIAAYFLEEDMRKNKYDLAVLDIMVVVYCFFCEFCQSKG